MKRLTLVAIALLVAAPAFAEPAAQDQAPAGQAATTDIKEMDALIVTGAVQDADAQRWSTDTDVAVPEISEDEWMPAAE
jgi:hypothetical protein